METPRVSVIIPTFNWSSVLPYSIGSVLAQTFRDFEVLVVGDGCTDDSERVVNAIGDERVRWINLPVHTGHQSGPNNRGLQEAKGELVAYLGHDDLWLPHHLECLVAGLDAAGADLAHGIVGWVRPGADTAAPVWPIPQARSWAPPSGMMHRRFVTETIGGWADYRDLRMAPDPELWRRAHAAGFTFAFVPRLTAIKFSAAQRRNVYRDKPCHEQAAWSQRISNDPHFEAGHLVAMMLTGEFARAMPGRMLFPLSLRELARRTGFRLREAARHAWMRKGGEIDDTKSFKGL